ncbi:hypothetical protein V7161_29715 [Neobacillus drentensis]|uniref:hypothetical protein n=1 Tax=Neobacillus drentensis TaxID=220684 RepID=UPI0030013536
MPTMKEIKTPFKLLGVRYFKDEDGQYYKKSGKDSRKKIKPFWKNKWLMIGMPLLILIIIGIGGYKFGMNIASQKMMNEIAGQLTNKDVEILLKDPSIQKIIEDELGSAKKEELLKKYSLDASLNVTNSNNKNTIAAKNDSIKETPEANQHLDDTNKPKLKFSSRQEVMKFLLSKFTMNELTELAKKADGGLTPEEKEEIQTLVLERLSDEEYDAVKVYALIELSNMNN